MKSFLLCFVLCVAACVASCGSLGQQSLPLESTSQEVSASSISTLSAGSHDSLPVSESSAPDDKSDESTSVSNDTQTVSSEMPTISAAYSTELTVQVVSPDKIPLVGIGVYAEPPNKWYLSGATAYAVTNSDGIAVLQRVDSAIKTNSKITVGVADRNQSSSVQQYFEVPAQYQDELATPVQLAWTGTLPDKSITDSNFKLTIMVVDQQKQPLSDMWVRLRPAQDQTSDTSNNDMGQEKDLPFEDWYKVTSTEGTVAFVGLDKGAYAVEISGGSPPFNLVASTNPVLNKERIYPHQSAMGYTVDYTADGIQSASFVFIPSK